MNDGNSGVSEELSFEQRLEELDKVVTDLESGELSLDDMLGRYEYGMKLVASCQQRLADAELQVTEIAAESSDTQDDMGEVPF